MSFIKNLSWRYATKKFDGSKVEETNLKLILDSIRMAPTSFGLQPFHVSVISNIELRKKLERAAFGQTQIMSASHILIFSVRTDVRARVQEYINALAGGDEKKREELKQFEGMMEGSLSGLSEENAIAWAARQAYIALGFGLAACAELQIDSCPMEGFNSSEFKEILNLPETLRVLAVLSIGTRDKDDTPHPKFRFPEADLFDFKY